MIELVQGKSSLLKKHGKAAFDKVLLNIYPDFGVC